MLLPCLLHPTPKNVLFRSPGFFFAFFSFGETNLSMDTLAMATHVKLQARSCSSDHALCPLALGQGSSLPWSTCAKRNRDSRWPSNRRGVFFSLHVKPPLWGCGTPSLGLGNFPSWRDFPFERTNQSAFIFTGPQAQIPSSPYQQGLGLVRG